MKQSFSPTTSYVEGYITDTRQWENALKIAGVCWRSDCQVIVVRRIEGRWCVYRYNKVWWQRQVRNWKLLRSVGLRKRDFELRA